jgi:hypothetical protein
MLILAALTALGGCSDSELDNEDRLLAKTNVKPTHIDRAQVTRSLSTKLQPYVRCINSVAARVAKSRRRYTSWIKDLKAGPTCKERYIYAPYKLYSVSNCTTKLIEANKTSPSLSQLEKAAKSYASAVYVLDKLLPKAYTYYQTRAYRSDKCALGQKMHPQLMAAFRLADTADKIMRSRVGYHNGVIMRQRLAEIASKYGTSHPRYFRRRVLADAKVLWRWIDVNDQRKDLTPEMISAQIAKYEQSINKMEAAPKRYAGYGYSSFKSAAKDYLTSTKEYLERKRTGKKYSRVERRWLASGSGWLVKGSVSRVLKRYNTLVNKYNAVRFR